MNKKIFFVFLIIAIISSCIKNNISHKNISFYHWKSKATFPNSYEKAINISQANKIYLHYFDIESIKESSWRNDGIFPTYVLKSITKEYQSFEIVPVVYITNEIFKTKNLDISDLSNRIKNLINQISETHFNKEIKQIQIDCDWTQSSKNLYFELLRYLEKHYELEVTIRLHQIKFKEKTGIPPVKKGTLMLYNVGDLKNKQQNSILESSIIKQYVSSETNYPLLLNIGLPLFSQTIVFNKDNKIKIIKNTERMVLENDSHFEKTDDVNFKVIKDTLYKGIFLNKDCNLKLEEINQTEITASYKTIKESNLKTNEIIFFHLDENSLSKINLKSLIEEL